MATTLKKFNALGMMSMLITMDGKSTLYLRFGEKGKLHEYTMPTKRQLKRRLAQKWERFVDVTTRRTVYFYSSGMDCDGVESGHRVKYKNILVAEKEQENDYEWADGPLYFNRLTKAEYMEAESHYRDRGMEAYENGHPHCY